MKYLFLSFVAIDLALGYMPTETSNVDAVSMLCFVAATVFAYFAGDSK
jgi:hypothetical protein